MEEEEEVRDSMPMTLQSEWNNGGHVYQSVITKKNKKTKK
jgi:hypothetical protein